MIFGVRVGLAKISSMASSSACLVAWGRDKNIVVPWESCSYRNTNTPATASRKSYALEYKHTQARPKNPRKYKAAVAILKIAYEVVYLTLLTIGTMMMTSKMAMPIAIMIRIFEHVRSDCRIGP